MTPADVAEALADYAAQLPPWVRTRDEDRFARASESRLLHGSVYFCTRCGDVLDPTTRQHLYGCDTP